MILKLVDKTTGESQSYNIRSNEDFTPIIMRYPEVRSLVFYGYEHSDLTEDYSPRLRKIVDDVAEYLKQYNMEVSIESENIWEMHDPMNPFEKAELEKGQNGDWKDEGYTLHLEGEPVYGNSFTVYAKDKSGKQVGYAGFNHMGDALYPEDTDIDHDHRRKGLATAMYRHAQMLTQTKVMPSENQTEEAEALWKQPNRPFGKAETFVTAASMLLALTTTFIPANLAKADIAKQVINVFKYRPYGHKPEDKFLQAIMELESSGGLNQNHQEPNCIGRWGLMSPTIKDMVRLFDTHNPDTQAFVNLDTPQLKQIFKKHPELELHVARILARYIITKQRGDMARAAYAWKYGQNTPPESITDDKLDNEPYIQKFKDFAGKMSKSDTVSFDQKLKTWIAKRKDKEANSDLWSPSEVDYSNPRDPDPVFMRDTSKLRANIARANR